MLPSPLDSTGPRSGESHVLDLFVEVLSQAETGGGDEFYGHLCEAVCRLAGMRRAVIFRYDSAVRRVRASGSFGIDLDRFADARLTLESAPIAARALREDRVVELAGDVGEEIPEPYAALIAGPTRLVCVPMGAAGREVGVLIAERPLREPPLDDAQRDLLWTLGKAAAVATVARIAATQAEKSKQLEHRLDFAREVHEGVVQRLFGVSMALDGRGPLPAQARRRCAQETQAALDELRSALQRPLGRKPRATKTTLVAEVARLATTYPELGVTLEGGRELDIPERLEPLVQSVLAEAIRNAHKHASPTAVKVSVRRNEGSLLLEIVNDGAPAANHAHTGMGLRLAAFEALSQHGILEFGQHGVDCWQVRLLVPVDV